MVVSLHIGRQGAARTRAPSQPHGAPPMRTRSSVVFLSLLALLVGAAVGLRSADAQERTLTVFAAASMKNALDEVDAAYTKKTGVKLAVSYAASSALMKQIEQGAPAD